jgi:hypothetical protein
MILGRVESKLTGPWAMRCKIRNAFLSSTDGFVTSAVTPMWKTAYDVAQKIRPEIESKLETMMDPIVQAQTKIMESINQAIESLAKGALQDKVAPNLQPILELLFQPLITSMQKLLIAFDKSLEKGREKYAKDEKNYYFVKNHWYTSEFWEAERVLWDLYDTLWDARTVFDEVYPWNILYKARRRIQKLLCNALYTFETLHAEGKSWEEAHSESRAMLLQDATKAIAWLAGRILEGIVDSLWNRLVVKPARDIVRPIADQIPEAVQQFCDIDRMLVEVLRNVLRTTCTMVFEPFASRVNLTA